MSYVKINEEYLNDIAEAIRYKSGASDTYKPREMAVAISNIGKIDSSGMAALLSRTLTELNTNATRIRDYAFSGIYWGTLPWPLTSVNAPKATEIGLSAFYYCTSLATVNLPSVITVEEEAFYSCEALTTINMPNVTTMEFRAFGECDITGHLDLPNIQSIGNYAFTTNKNLVSADLHNITTIGAGAFDDCSKLETVILRSNTMTKCGRMAFYNTPIDDNVGYIYVPAALIESYRTAREWTDYWYQFRAIEDYPDICG